jgi:hypothetical protein
MDELERACEYVSHEAAALRETVLLADSLPPEVRTMCDKPSRSIFISSSRKNGPAKQRYELAAFTGH